MDIVQTKEGAKLTLGLTGELGHHEAIGIMEKIEAAVDTALPRELTLDLSGVGFMDSSGIAVVLKGYKAAREISAVYNVLGTNPQAMKVLNAAGLQKIVTFKNK